MPVQLNLPACLAPPRSAGDAFQAAFAQAPPTYAQGEDKSWTWPV